MGQRRVWIVFLIGLLLAAAGFVLWRQGQAPAVEPNLAYTSPGAPAAPQNTPGTAPVATQPFALVNTPATVATAGSRSQFPYRVSNTSAGIEKLMRDDRAILLRNALIDTTRPLDLTIPAHLRAPTNTRTYIVQARGVITESFRAMIGAAGARIVENVYIPNNALLVRVSPQNVAALQASALTQAVLPWEPFYKLDDRLMDDRYERYRVLSFPGEEAALAQALQAAGAPIEARDRSVFGTIFTVDGRQVDAVTLARIDEAQLIEPKVRRTAANDLTRVSLGVAADTTTTTNYLDLDGTNILISFNDSGVDTNHPDLKPRVLVDLPTTASDPSGHGTHVIGTAISSGANSTNVSAPGSVAGANFRGVAPAAKAFVMQAVGADEQSDVVLQEMAAATNALIQNNSWGYPGAFAYDLSAADYDYAVRDAQPGVPGSQPLAIVFAAGNAGFGNDNGNGGEPGSVVSPGTAKNVITVGGSELPRNITNEVVRSTFNGTTNVTTTNQPWLGSTDSSDQVAPISSRGNVGVGIEGDRGRFKPDVVAPGVFVVSTRSADWDQESYYHPTNRTPNRFRSQIIQPGEQVNFSIFVPDNAVRLQIQVLPNVFTEVPFPQLPIYVRQVGIPTTTAFDLLGTNAVSLPPDHPLDPVATSWFYSIVNPGSNVVNVDVRTVVSTTNDVGNYYQVLSNLNETLDTNHLYRYESGSSVAAPAVSGMLALMEEYFEQRMQPSYSPTNRPSPALLKALVINGARSLGPLYNLGVSNLINFQGWGLASMTNSLPPTLSNAVSQVAGQTKLPMQFYDQNPTNSLTTGQSQTRRILVSEDAQLQSLRFTLVWTDPPGNPAAGPKLVNDLDLIVTNLDNPTNPVVYYGNDIPVGFDFNQTGDTNSNPDVINNVENVFLNGPVGSNYAVTVYARRVNVNAVTAQTNGIAQDYALVISSGDGGAVTNAFSVTETNGVVFTNAPLVTIVKSNGVPLFHQRVGANNPLLTSSNGTSNQWHFFIYTNATTFTNVAFVTFLPPDLSLPRIGVREIDNDNAARIEADIDLYVSTDPKLLNLDPTVISSSLKALSRGGTEAVILSNANANQVFYVGVKSEDQMAAEFGFLGVSSELPFSFLDANGNEHLRGLSVPVEIPDGTPPGPGGAMVFALAAYPIEVRKVVVTNTITHEAMGDLLGNLNHGQTFAVLNNHRPSPVPGFASVVFIYDDSGEYPIPGAQTTDGPGSLRSFVGSEGAGVWILTMVDNSLNQTGRVDSLGIQLDRVYDDTVFNRITIPPRSFFFDVVNVPPEATNLTVVVANMNPALPVELYIRQGDFPTRALYDKFKLINPPGGSLSVDLFDSPPLSAGRYYIGIFNPNPIPVTVDVAKRLGLAANPNSTGLFTDTGSLPLLDDAVSRSTITITTNRTIARAEVGLIIEHPRVSDLALTLVSPIGTRVLLTEDRGGLTTAGFGKVLYTTNVAPASSSGGPVADTNVIHVGANAGTLRVDYDFHPIPDIMQVFYDGAKIYDTGLVQGSNSFTVNFGPGASTDLTIVMNPLNNSDTNTDWNYTATVVSSSGLYATFTDNTNRTTTPIKFAVPPFVPGNGPAQSIPISGFETTAGVYTNGDVVDGWTVQTNQIGQISIINDPVLANTGTNLLALANGRISRTLPTIAGRKYRLSHAYRGPGIVAWWRGETDAGDSVGANHGVFQGGAGLAAGRVGSAFDLKGPAARSYVQMPDSDLWAFGANDFSIDLWVNFRSWTSSGDFTQPEAIFIGNDEAPNLFNKWFFDLGAGKLSFHVNGPAVGPIFLIQSPFAPAVNQWYHLAVVRHGDTFTIFRDGIAVGSETRSVVIPNPNAPLTIGQAELSGFVDGLMDEVSIYHRALSDSEIKAIYTDGARGKFDPSIAAPANLAKARLTIDSGLTNTFFAQNDAWQTNDLTFTANQNGTTLELVGLEPGMLLDSFTLSEVVSPAVYYLPEESLDVLVGENVRGTWTLEAWDTRVGASNNVPRIVDWQLDFAFANVESLARPLHHAEPVAATVRANSVQYYVVDVPLWASFATNTLFGATAPLNLFYNANGLPVPAAPPDIQFLTAVTNGSRILYTNQPPPLVPGGRYFLAVQNPNAQSVSYSIEVEFDVTTLTNEVPLVTSQPGLRPRYYQYDVSTNALAILFETFGANGNVDLVVRRGLPLPDLEDHDYASLNPGTNDEFIAIGTNSSPVSLTPVRWYAGVFNQELAKVDYTIRVTELTSIDPVIIDYTRTSNSLCLTWTSIPTFSYYVVGKMNLSDPLWVPVSPTIIATARTTTYCIPLPTPYRFFDVRLGRAPSYPNPDEPITIPPGGIAYFLVPVPDWPYAATNTLIAADLPLDLLFNQFGLPTGTTPGDFTLLSSQTNGVFTLLTNSTPPLMTNQFYFLGLHNTNSAPATAFLQVEFNITRLTNAIALNDTLLSTIPRYFSLAVPPDAAATFFNLFNLSGNADLVVRENGFGLPTLTSFDFGSFNPGTANDRIVVTTNSNPALTANVWNLSVYNRTTRNVAYTIRATAVTNLHPVIIRTEIIGTNLCVTWSSIPDEPYFLAGKVELGDPVWVPVSPTVVATGLETTYCIALPTPYRYFSVFEGEAPLIPDPNVPVTIPPDDIVYFVVPVPDWPYATTNTLVNATLPLDLIFNQNGLPTGTAVGDVTLLTNQFNGVFTILTNGTPPLVTNRNYYLGLRNTNSVPVIATLQVEFNITPLANGQTVNDTLLSPIPRYFSFAVPTGAEAATFELFNLNANSDLVVQELALPTLASFDYGSFNQGTNDEAITVTTNAALHPLTTNTWNLSVFNRTQGPAGYTVRVVTGAITNTNPGPIIIGTENNGTNLCLTWTSIPGSNYYVGGKVDLMETNWAPVSPTITATSNLTTYCISLPTPYRFFSVQFGTAPTIPPPNPDPGVPIIDVSGTNLCLTWNSAPGTNYYVSGKVDLTDALWVPVSPTITATSNLTTYCLSLPTPYRFFMVQIGIVPPPPNPDPGVPVIEVSGTNLCLTWNSAPGTNYFVTGKVNLSDTNWVPVSPTITATNTLTTYCLSLPTPYRFFQVQIGTVPSPNPDPGVPVIEVSSTNLCLTWNSLPGTNYFVSGKVDLNDTNWVQVSPIITATSNLTTYCLSLPTPYRFFMVQIGTVPTPPNPDPGVPVIGVSSTNLCLTWNSAPGTNYVVAGKADLSDTNWVQVSPIITATSNLTSYCLSLPTTNRFFTVQVVTVPAPNPDPGVPVIGVSSTNLCLTWNSAPGTNYVVAGKADLNDTNWVPVSPIITATSNLTSYCLSLPTTNRFFTVQVVAAPAPNPDPGVPVIGVSSTNLCLTWSSAPGTNYYVAGKADLSDTNWVQVSPIITATSNLTSYCLSLPTTNRFFTVQVVTAPAPVPDPGVPVIGVSSTNLCLTWNSVPGTNYVVAGKADLSDTNWVPVSPIITATSNLTSYCLSLPTTNRFFTVQVVAAPASVPDPGVPVIGVSSTNLCLTWNSVSGGAYYVAGKLDLSDPGWAPVSPTITATNNQTTYCVLLPTAYRFFQVVVGSLPTTTPPVFRSIVKSGGSGFALTWEAPLTARFQVQWANAFPPAWNTISNILVPTATNGANGVFTFTDDGSKTGGLGQQRFYQLLQLP